MPNARIWVFDVEQGFCAFIEAPNGRTMMIDCGRAEFFSPVEYLREKGYTLTMLHITHPHDDHIRDIVRVMQCFVPQLLRWSVYDWPEIQQAPEGDYENLRAYVGSQEGYMPQGAPEPDWGGMTTSYWSLGVNQAKKLNDSNFVNNSSYIAIITIGQFKMVFPGDIERDGWLEMLKRQEFREALAGTNVFVASHHGHSSGYASEVFDVMGRPYVNVLSCHRRDPSVESAYSTPDRAIGVPEPNTGRTRYSFTTRNDGTCYFEVSESGQANYWFLSLDDNLG